MDQVFRGLDFVFVYIDDILIASSSPEEHMQHVREVFQRLSNHGILINPSKCLFGVAELEFLGHHVSSEGICPLEHKLEAVRKFPQPTSARQLRVPWSNQFLSPLRPPLCPDLATSERSANCSTPISTTMLD